MLVSEAAGRADAHVPSWLNEGLAEYGNIDPTDGYESALRYGIFNGQVKPLWYQASFSGTPDDIIIAYGQGRSVVKHMIETHGPEKMGQLMKALQKTLDIDLALEQVYGFDQHGLDSEWRLTVGLEPLPPPERLELELQQFPTDPAPAQDSEATVEPPAATAGTAGRGSTESRRDARGRARPKRGPGLHRPRVLFRRGAQSRRRVQSGNGCAVAPGRPVGVGLGAGYATARRLSCGRPRPGLSGSWG